MERKCELQWTQVMAEFEKGDYREYRIPGIVVTDSGTIICCCEGRMDETSDWGRIDLVIWRSTDDGATWQRGVVRIPGMDMMNNPTLIADGDQVVLIVHTDYARAWCMESADEGATWSCAREITQAYREFPYEWNVCATGPGHGVRLQGGRLLAPVWLANGERLGEREIAHHPSAAGCVWSDDRGATWHAGAMEKGMCDANETSAVQLDDGRVMFNFRNCEKDYCRRLGFSADGGATLGAAQKCDDLPDPWCFGGMAALKDGGVVFAGCHSGAARPEAVRLRADLRLKVSDDAGAHWQTLAFVDEAGGYADVFAHGETVYVLYEATDYARMCVGRMLLKKYRICR